MCSGCGYVMDAASPVEGGPVRPVEGSISICMNCGLLHTRHEDRWTRITDAEWRGLSAEQRKQLMMVEMVRQMTVLDDLTARDKGRT